jgi:hypothetical protein
VGDTVPRHTLQENELEISPKTLRVENGEVSDRLQEPFMWANGARGFVSRSGYATGAILSLFDRGGIDALRIHVYRVIATSERVVRCSVRLLVIVLDSDSVCVARIVDPWVFFPEGRAKRNMIPLEPGVVLDDSAMEIGKEEDVGDEESTKEASQDDTDGLPGAKLLKRRCCGSLDHQEQCKDRRSEGEVDGDETHGPLE